MLLDLLVSFFQSFMLFTLQLAPSSFPRPLTAAEERDCFARLARGDAAAREMLISHNLRLVVHVIKKYYTSPADQDDLISIGTIGLIKAVDTFNAKKGTRFATYAARCIQNEVLMQFRSARKARTTVYISDPLEPGEDALTILDVLSDERDIAEETELRQELDRVGAAVRTSLHGREKLVIELRYGFGGHPPQTQQAVASMLGISRSYISRIEKKALEKLRAALGSA